MDTMQMEISIGKRSDNSSATQRKKKIMIGVFTPDGGLRMDPLILDIVPAIHLLTPAVVFLVHAVLRISEQLVSQRLWRWWEGLLAPRGCAEPCTSVTACFGCPLRGPELRQGQFWWPPPAAVA